MIIPDDFEHVMAAIEDAAEIMRNFVDYMAQKIAEAVEELGEWIDYDKPYYPPYVPVKSFRPLVINQLCLYTSGFL